MFSINNIWKYWEHVMLRVIQSHICIILENMLDNFINNLVHLIQITFGSSEKALE